MSRCLLIMVLSAGCSFGMTPVRPGFPGALDCTDSVAAPGFDAVGGILATAIAAVKLGPLMKDPNAGSSGDVLVGSLALVLDVPFWVSAVSGFNKASECSRAKAQALRSAAEP
jgi:hypothetical protein